MKTERSTVSDSFIVMTAAFFVIGLVVLGMRLKEIQVDGAAAYSYAGNRQSVRRVQVGGTRGRILDRHRQPIAENRRAVSIVANPEAFQRRTWEATISEISNAVLRAGDVIGSPSSLTERQIARHVRQELALPLVAWRDVDDESLARFAEHENELPGFSLVETDERIYPCGSTAAHLIGYVGRDRFMSEAGDERIHFSIPEMKGRSGLEAYYNDYLRGVSGQQRLVVDARGYAVETETIIEPSSGLDLVLTIDIGLQREVERQLEGECGACAVIDPRNGEVLALASAPTFDLNDFVPTLPASVYERYADDPDKPLLNRASGGSYAPGSTFKTVTALAGLAAGLSPSDEYECTGVFVLGSMRLRCARRWGHGPLDMRQALRESCNTYFCNLGMEIGTNALFRAARAFGLGSKTGIDLGVDTAGAVPDAVWKMQMYGERWYPGDLAQMAIGQGMLLVSPLQMACVAGAIGTGFLVTPHLNVDIGGERHPLPFGKEHLDVIREGMRLVVDGGTGRRGGEDVAVPVAGKTGTAEVGIGSNRRKNTWFIAYAPAEAPTVAVAMVIENGASGGGTTAPRVAEILRWIFNDR